MIIKEHYKISEAAKVIGHTIEDLIHCISTKQIPIAIQICNLDITDESAKLLGKVLNSKSNNEKFCLTGKYYLSPDEIEKLEIKYRHREYITTFYAADNKTILTANTTNPSSKMIDSNLTIDSTEMEKLADQPKSDNGRKLGDSKNWIDLEKAISEAEVEICAWLAKDENKIFTMPDIDKLLRKAGITNDKAIEVAKAVLADNIPAIFNKRGKKVKPLTTLEKKL